MPTVISMNKFPMPPIGLPVVWYDAAHKLEGQEVAALVCGVSSGGKGVVNIRTFPWRQREGFYQDSHHVTDPIHQRNANTTFRSGGWDFLPNLGPETYSDL